MANGKDEKVRILVFATGVASGRHLEKGATLSVPLSVAKEAISLGLANFASAPVPAGTSAAGQQEIDIPAAQRAPGRKTKKANQQLAGGAENGESGDGSGGRVRTPLPDDFPARQDLASLEINDLEALKSAEGYLMDVLSPEQVSAISERLAEA